jgi:hypothetical protein
VTMAAIAADLLVSQHQVQRLMAMRRHFRAQKPQPGPDWWAAWGAAMAMQLDEATFLQSALAATGRAANDARMEVPA